MQTNLIGTKEGSSLLFMKETKDGNIKSLKFDFKDNSFYTSTRKENWRKVKSAGMFFNGFTTNQVINSFEDNKYREFLQVVLSNVKSETRYGYESKIGNPSKLLNYIPQFLHLESWLLLGIKFQDSGIRRDRAKNGGRWYASTEATEYFSGIKVPVNIFQKEVLQFMKELGERYSEQWVLAYQQHEQTFINLCTFVRSEYHMDLEVYMWAYDLLMDYGYGNYREKFLNLVNRGMEYKALFRYLVKVDRTEALGFINALQYLSDYIRMNAEMRNTRADRYPFNLTMRHNITVRNYNTNSATYEKQKFIDAIDYSLDWMNNEYAVISPIDPEEMKIEGNKLHHCVASYINKVINGACQIMFLRDLKDGNEPLVTVEIVKGAIGQVSRSNNEEPTPEQVEVLKEFAKAKRLFYKDYSPLKDIEEDRKRAEKAKQQEKNNEECN